MPGLFLSEKVFAECASVISLSYGYDSKLPIVLFVGRRLLGSLFEWIQLSI